MKNFENDTLGNTALRVFDFKPDPEVQTRQAELVELSVSE